jgi:DoxX-like protein
MKKINIIYWILTGLFAAFILMTSVWGLSDMKHSIAFMSVQLGYPAYIIPFLDIAKILGAIAIIVPGFPKLKEWAYAGLFFDLTGALYSLISIKAPVMQTGIMFVIMYAFLFGSYILYHKRLTAV